MITLLHGDNIVVSRSELMRRIEEAKKQEKEIRQLDGKSLDTLTLTQAVESSSLFGGTVFVVIEALLAKLGKKEKLATLLTDIIKRSGDTADIILWEEKEIGKTLVTLLGNKVSVQLFKTPVAIFQLLDVLAPGNFSPLIDRFHRALELDAVERIFIMIVRRARELIIVKDGVTPEGLQSWQVGRLTSQAKLFTMDKLLSMEKRLLDIDVSNKTGTSPFPLAQQLELFFIDL